MDEETYSKFIDIFRRESGTLRPDKPTPRKTPEGWATVRIFCSSTFKDQLVERYILKSVVIPELELWGRERCIEFVMIDLVWGIVAGSTAEHTIRTCLTEIDVCSNTNGAPYFLYLGGQRYGWAPTAEDIGNEELVRKYNMIAGASVTAMEVLHGSLRTRNPNALYCLRSPKFLASIPPTLTNDYAEKQGSVGEACQKALLDVIQESCCGDAGVIHYNPASDSSNSGLASPSESLLGYLPANIEGHGGNWDHFASQVTSSLKQLISAQYPPSQASEDRAGSIDSMHAQHDLYVESLLEHAVPRQSALVSLRATVVRAAGSDAPGRRLITIASPSGNGKSSLVGQLSRALSLEGYLVIHHFVGPAERSDEVGILARRVTHELRLAWGRETSSADDLPDDVSEICSLSRQTILLGPPPAEPGAERKRAVVLITDAVNQLNADSAEGRLAWLPSSAEDCAAIPPGLVIIASTTPGPELEMLRRLCDDNNDGGGCSGETTESDVPRSSVFELGSLDDTDKLSIAQANLDRFAKSFSAEQLGFFLANSGSSSPLWQNIAMSYLRQHALFETLTEMIKSLPSRVEELINLELGIAESEIGLFNVRALLMSCVLARQGVRESEGMLLVPEVAALLSALHHEACEQPSASAAPGSEGRMGTGMGAMDAMQWSRLRAQLDIFLLHFMCGAPIMLTPSHSIVRDAITARYCGDVLVTSRVRRTIANFFIRDISTIDASRRAVEGTWQLVQLGDQDALAELLCSPSVFSYQWLGAGDTGHWELLQLWRVVDKEPVEEGKEAKLGEGETDEAAAEGSSRASKSIAHLTGWAMAICERLIVAPPHAPHSSVDEPTFVILRGIFELLTLLRREQAALPFLQRAKALLLPLVEEGGREYLGPPTSPPPLLAAEQSPADYSGPTADPHEAYWTARLVLAWTHGAIGESLYEQGKYSLAVPIFQACIAELQSVPTLHPDECVAACHLQLGRIFDAEKRLDLALEAFEAARRVYSALDDPGRPAQAAFVRRVLIKKKVHSASSALMHEADTWIEIANVHFSKHDESKAAGDLELSEDCYRKSLSLRRRCLGDKHPKTARAIWGIGICERGKGIADKTNGMLERSIRTHQEVLAIFQHCLGPNHPDTADMIYNIAYLFADQENYRAALVEFNTALNVYIRTYGPRHRHVGWTYTDIGEVARKAGLLDEAVEAYERALSIRIEALGPDDEATLETSNALAQCVAEQALKETISRIEAL